MMLRSAYEVRAAAFAYCLLYNLAAVLVGPSLPSRTSALQAGACYPRAHVIQADRARSWRLQRTEIDASWCSYSEHAVAIAACGLGSDIHIFVEQHVDLGRFDLTHETISSAQD